MKMKYMWIKWIVLPIPLLILILGREKLKFIIDKAKNEKLKRRNEIYKVIKFNKQKLRMRIEQYKIIVHNPCREGRKLLVLDIDYTLLDPDSSSAENPLGLMRPYLHECLSTVYAEYDIIIWSASSMERIVSTMGGLGVLNNPNFKITAMLDILAMVKARSYTRGIDIDCKPLGLIWANFREFYSPKNTIMIDDLSINFWMNTKHGLIIKPFRKPHSNENTDRQLMRLSEYLLAIAHLDDRSGLNHKNWKSNEDYIKRRRQGKSKLM